MEREFFFSFWGEGSQDLSAHYTYHGSPFLEFGKMGECGLDGSFPGWNLLEGGYLVAILYCSFFFPSTRCVSLLCVRALCAV